MKAVSCLLIVWIHSRHLLVCMVLLTFLQNVTLPKSSLKYVTREICPPKRLAFQTMPKARREICKYKLRMHQAGLGVKHLNNGARFPQPFPAGGRN